MKPEPLSLERARKKTFSFVSIAYTNELEEFADLFIENVREEIKQACLFYLRYVNRPNVFVKENPSYKREIGEQKKNYIDKDGVFAGTMWLHFLLSYNEWLFKIAFKEVLEEEK